MVDDVDAPHARRRGPIRREAPGVSTALRHVVGGGGNVAGGELRRIEHGSSVAAELRALLDDHPSVVDYETAVVLAVEPQSARVFFADRGEQTIGFDAMSWAAPFVNDDAVGTKPTS